MASNQETRVLGCGLVFAEDSFLLSDYLHRQAERAGNRLFSKKNSFLSLRSKIFSSQVEQEKGEYLLGRCSPQGIDSMSVDLTSASKETSDILLVKECSPNVLLEPDQQKRDSSWRQRSFASSNSCTESFPGCESESGFRGSTRADITKNESLHNNLLGCKTKAEISLSSCGTEYVQCAADKFPTTKHGTEALDLLVLVAMAASDHNASHDAALPSSTALVPGESCASAANGTLRPILRKRVVRRAKSAFQKQLVDDSTGPKFKFCEFLRRKENDNCSKKERIAQKRHEFHVAYAKEKALQDVSHSSLHVSRKTSMFKGLEGDFSASNKNIPQIAVETAEYHGNAVNYRKLQTSSSRLLDVYDAERPESTHTVTGPPKYAPSKFMSRDNQLTVEVSKGMTNWVASIGKSSNANSRAMPVNDVKQINSFLKLKILPVRQSSQQVSCQGNGCKVKNSDFDVEECQMVTRNRSTQQRMKKENACSSITALSSAGQRTITQTETSQVTNSTDHVMRTKRGRSQVLPTKFSDSVLQPWKRSRRKIQTPDA